jgi:replicative superfamily II helicase
MYFLTPVFNLPPPDWQYFSAKLWTRLEPTHKEIAKLFSIEEGYIITLANKQYASKMTKSTSTGSEETLDKKTVASRFFWALCLTDIINEIPISQLEHKYRISRGNIQSFIQSAEMWCSSIVNFCKNLDFWVIIVSNDKKLTMFPSNQRACLIHFVNESILEVSKRVTT